MDAIMERSWGSSETTFIGWTGDWRQRGNRTEISNIQSRRNMGDPFLLAQYDLTEP